MTVIILSKKQENENVRANLLLLFFPFMVCLNQKRKKKRKRKKRNQKTGKEKRKLTWEGDIILFLCCIMNYFIKGASEKVHLLGGEEGVC